jgi:RimJ/RimL family protein N-acetyltransferase
MLIGERVTLRAQRREDLIRQAEWDNDLQTKLLADDDPPRPVSLEWLQAQYDREMQDERKIRDEAWFAMEVGGVLIGGCGLMGMSATHRTCWLGISIGDPDSRGKGYGREAIGLLLEYAFRYRNMRKVCLSTGSDNERAQRCYRACGFVEEGRLRQQEWCDGRYIDSVQMGLLREEWETR